MSASRMLDGAAARHLAEAAGVSFAPWRLAGSLDEAVAAAGEIGWPVALKTAAEDVAHKSDAGCVALELDDAAALAEAHGRVTANAAKAGSATPDLILVEQMTEGLAELVIGLKRSQTFGPVLLVGLGGVWVEVLRDFALRLCPITEAEARGMLAELRGIALLTGDRGHPPCDLDALAAMAAAVSRLGSGRDDVLELDLNPVVAMARGAVAVDARAVLRAAEEEPA